MKIKNMLEHAMRVIYKNSYNGMAHPDGTDASWIRTTQNGIIPYQSSTAGSSSLGTASWPFLHLYAKNMHGSWGWTSLGSTTGTGQVNFNLANYTEICICAHTVDSGSTTKRNFVIIPKAFLSSTAYEVWVGGGKSNGTTANGGSLRQLCNVTNTYVKGVVASASTNDRTSSTTWYVYAR